MTVEDNLLKRLEKHHTENSIKKTETDQISNIRQVQQLKSIPKANQENMTFANENKVKTIAI